MVVSSSRGEGGGGVQQRLLSSSSKCVYGGLAPGHLGVQTAPRLSGGSSPKGAGDLSSFSCRAARRWRTESHPIPPPSHDGVTWPSGVPPRAEHAPLVPRNAAALDTGAEDGHRQLHGRPDAAAGSGGGGSGGDGSPAVSGSPSQPAGKHARRGRDPGPLRSAQCSHAGRQLAGHSTRRCPSARMHSARQLYDKWQDEGGGARRQRGDRICVHARRGSPRVQQRVATVHAAAHRHMPAFACVYV